MLPHPGVSGTERSLLQGCLGLNRQQLGDTSVGQVAESLFRVCSGPVQGQAERAPFLSCVCVCVRASGIILFSVPLDLLTHTHTHINSKA